MLLKLGSKGDDVKKLQQQLGITADGDFGKNTETAVINFQKKNGLQADGVVGDKTWQKLFEKNTSSAPASTVPSSAGNTPKASTSGFDFNYCVALIIDNIEGGYYHPKMFEDGRLNKKYEQDYAYSGETMFGLDRTAGHDLFYKTPKKSTSVKEDITYIESGAYEYKSEGAREFWGALDKAGAKNTWKWGYMGGDLKPRLKVLAAEAMKPQYDLLAGKYLGTYRTLVESDKRLAFHFVYACWNGAGWFKKFADDFAKAAAAGKKTADEFAQVALDSRTKEGLKPGSAPNKLIAQGGEKIKVLFDKMKAGTI